MNTLVTWENLQARLYHLGWLGEELPEFVSRNTAGEDAPTGAWLFRQIIREARAVAAIAAEYVAECERAGLSGPNGTTPAPAAWHVVDETRPADTPAEAARAEDVAGRIPEPRPGADAADLRTRHQGGDAL
ncbi:hypothetical protein [Amycolatopsis sp.]|jgi:hypothetical protein|uniref:hypothetical protein n=1 Tax=Amycolatopsis sp. TaxID=37632 RepID=UPI002E013224|nr:hypothetical protein [Amycolatopsis sp.]